MASPARHSATPYPVARPSDPHAPVQDTTSPGRGNWRHTRQPVRESTSQPARPGAARSFSPGRGCPRATPVDASVQAQRTATSMTPTWSGRPRLIRRPPRRLLLTGSVDVHVLTDTRLGGAGLARHIDRACRGSSRPCGPNRSRRLVGTRQNGKRFPGLLEDDGRSGARLFHLILFRRLEVALTTGAFYPAPR